MPVLGPSKGPHVDDNSSPASAALLDGPPAGHLVAPIPPPPSPELHAAFAQAQAAFEPLKFNARNAHFQNPYATLDAMLAAVRPALNKHGISLIQHVHYEGRHVAVTTELWHAGSVYRFATLEGQTKEQDPTPQQQAAAATYLKRQALSANLGIAGELDDDGEIASQTTTAPRRTDAPRSSASRTAKLSKKPAPDPRASSPEGSGDQAAASVKFVGVVDEVTEGSSKKGRPFWKVKLSDADGKSLLVFVWDTEVGGYIQAGQRSDISYEPGEYPKAVSWCHLREDGTAYIPGFGEVPF